MSRSPFLFRFIVGLLLMLIYGVRPDHTLPVNGQERPYRPIPLPSSHQIADKLTVKDIPTGDGGFARDYSVMLSAGDQIAIDVLSEEFDTVVMLLAEDGSAIAENDDGPDGTTNSLLFARISESGNYIVRVKAFGETGSGDFTLKVNRLAPIKP